MKAPREPRQTKKQTQLEEDLDRSRKQKLWLRSNYIASIAIVAFFGLSFMNMVSDVRGEYGGNCDSMRGMIICSVVHTDKQLNITMIMPNTPILFCATSDENVGSNVDWAFMPTHPEKDTKPIHFKGKVENNSLTGIIQSDLRIYPVSLSKDMITSIARQLRAFIPGAN